MPTLKQRKAMKKISELLGDMDTSKSYGEILREAGYSVSVSKKPKSVFTSKGYTHLESLCLDKISNDTFKELLVLINQHANLAAKVRGIDIYYKLTGRYSQQSKTYDTDSKYTALIKKVSSLLPD